MLNSISKQKLNHSITPTLGIGHGPAYIGGRDTDANGTKIALEVYSQYRQYKKINGQMENEDYYKR